MTTRNGAMITLARELNGISQSSLSSNIPNLSQSTLSQLEIGILDVSYETWNKIADFFELPLSFFSLERPKTPLSSFYYRKRQTIPKKQLSILEAQIDIMRISIDKLLDIVDIPEFNLPVFDLDGSPDRRSSIETAARKIREYLRIPKGPILKLVEALERNGIIVYFFKEVNDKFDGLTIFSDKGQPVIFVNDKMPNDRKRFTIAHELGHLVLHIRTIQDIDRDEELEANLFASEFLMPKIEISPMLYYLNLNKASTLKNYWLVSKAALIRRAYDLQIIDRNKYSYLNIEMSRRGEKKVERENIPIDNPSIITKIIEALKENLSYTSDEIRKVLFLSKNLYNSLFESDKLRIVV